MDYATFAADPIIIAAQLDCNQDAVEQIIDEVSCLLPKSRFATLCTDCNRRDLAIKYLTAHRLTLLKRSGILDGEAKGIIPGQITSISASQGSQSLGFSQVSQEATGGWLSEGQTPTYWWGLFMSMVQSRKVAIGFTA